MRILKIVHSEKTKDNQYRACMLVFICFVNKQLKLLSPVAVTVTNYFFEKSNCNLVFSHDFTYARDFFAEM